MISGPEAPVPTSTFSLSGLSAVEAETRLRAEGFNELEPARQRSTLLVIAEVLREPMFLLLLASAALYLLLGDGLEAVMLSCSVFIIIGITIYQERKTERALHALRELSSPRALVVRDGTPQRVPGREVVRGDLLILAEGDRVAADGRLRTCNDLSVDESLLSGESVPVHKLRWDPQGRDAQLSSTTPGGEDQPFVYAGSLVVQGSGLAEVSATGPGTAMGAIGRALSRVEPEEPLISKASRRVIRDFALIGLAASFVLVVLYGLSHGNWLEALLAGVTLAISLLPEEIPVVLTVFLALGAWRIAGQRVLTRRVSAIETLGSATVLCVDKTGTLTLNSMAIRELWAVDQATPWRVDGPLPTQLRSLLAAGIRASEEDPFDPMEQAFVRLWQEQWDAAPTLGETLVYEYALDESLRAMTHVWASPSTPHAIVACKGAPESVSRLCRLTQTEGSALMERVEALAQDGLRVLAVAQAEADGPPWPADPSGFNFQLLGLVGLADPIRPSASQAIDECRDAGIRVVMITGDYAGTARGVARQIGLASDIVISGDELANMSDQELRARVAHTSVFARVVPDQKLRLVEALKANREIVAMTGDGVNDAPALKAAHIGIAMGGRGTDVAREAAAIVLLDDDFASIVASIRQGRRIFDNLGKAIGYIFAVHVPIAGVALIPVLLGWPMVLMPMHVVFLELIIDPICSVAFEAEPEEDDVMRRPPRGHDVSLYSRATVGAGLLQGLSILAPVLLAYHFELDRGQSEGGARAVAFAALVLGNLVLIWANRSPVQPTLRTLRLPNRALWLVSVTALGFLVLVVSVPQLQQPFRFEAIGLESWALSLVAALTSGIFIEVIKGARRASGSRSSAS